MSVYSDSEPWRFQWVSDAEPQSPKEAPQSPKQAPPSPDYVPGPEHPLSPNYVPALSSGYVADSDLKDDPEEDLADYPADEGDDEEEEESSNEHDDKEEEHLAPADSTLPAIDSVFEYEHLALTSTCHRLTAAAIKKSA
ncbi:hypothetical protein Tco_0519173 [Tanacetum coccineum]